MSFLNHIIEHIKAKSIKFISNLPIETFNNSIKIIKNNTENKPIEIPEKKNCINYFKCLINKRKKINKDNDKKKEIKLNFQLNDFVNNLTKNYTNFHKVKLSELRFENNYNIININYLENKLQDICFEKYLYICQLIDLEKTIKEEVDKFSNFFNIQKLIEDQNLLIKKFKKKQEKQEDNITSIECIICMENDRNVVFFPCMHLIACKKCGIDLIKNDCPKCHAIIEKREIIEI
jgi:hypothetical protein